MKKAFSANDSNVAYEFRERQSDTEPRLLQDDSAYTDPGMNNSAHQETDTNSQSGSQEKYGFTKSYSVNHFVTLMLLRFTSIFVVPLLGGLAIGFGAGAVIAIIAGILRSLGIEWIPMSFLFFTPSKLLSLPIALIAAIVSGGIALGSWKILRTYMNYVRLRLNS